MDIHSQLQTIDFVVIAVYAVSVIGLGMGVSYRRRASDDLFLAGRSFGWPSVGLSIFATNVNPSFMIASCSVAYASGMVAANFDWLAWWFLVLLAMVFVPYYLNTGVSTMPEFMERRFGKATHAYLSWYALFTTMILWLGGALYTGSLLMSQIMGWPLWVAALVLSLRPDLLPDELAALLRDTARDLGPPGWDAATGAGMVDAARAVRAALMGRN